MDYAEIMKMAKMAKQRSGDVPFGIRSLLDEYIRYFEEEFLTKCGSMNDKQIKETYLPQAQEMDSLSEKVIEKFRLYASINDMKICETIKYVTDHRVHAWYYGGKYPFKAVTYILDDIMKVKDYDHSGYYD